MEDYVKELGFKINSFPGPDQTEWRHPVSRMKLIYDERKDQWYFQWGTYEKTTVNNAMHLDNIMRVLHI